MAPRVPQDENQKGLTVAEIHPNDRVYALSRAVSLAEQAGEPRNVVEDLRQLHEEAKREAGK